jgi:hypothetical protein
VKYSDFLARKLPMPLPSGIDNVPDLHPDLFPVQRIVTEFCLRAGRAAEFLDTGLGKTFSQLEWARVVADHTGAPVLIFAPLAVSHQTAREAARFGIPVEVVKSQDDIAGQGIYITNYEKLKHFSPEVFGGVVLDESSILKSFGGSTKRALIESFANTPFRLCCTATPSPNDHAELGNHAEFLGLCTQMEMLQRFFVNDTKEASQKWRLKGHAVEPFWDWVASWARCVGKPSDLGCSDDGFTLPRLNLNKLSVDVDIASDTGEYLFRMPVLSSTGMHKERRKTTDARAERIAGLVNDDHREPWIVWCDTDYEADALMARIPDAVEVKGTHTPESKEANLLGFSDGSIRVLVTKPKIAGFGLNWQHCARVGFVGLSYSYEAFYQAVRRCWRYGQTREVDVYAAISTTEEPIWETILRKSGSHDELKSMMVAATQRANETTRKAKQPYIANHNGRLPKWL